MHGIDPHWRAGSLRMPVLALATLVAGILLAGCGGTSARPSAAVNGARSPASSAAAGRGASRSSATARGTGGSGPLAFAECMRANGVPAFPDPNSGRGTEFPLPAGADPAAPAFRAAQAKCQKLMPGLPLPGSTTHPSSHTLAKLVRIAQCMRRSGVPQFPDPRTSVPANPSGVQEITDFDGAILLFPSTINLQAPAYRHALTVCGAPPLGLPH